MYIVQVMKKIDGSEYPTVSRKDALSKPLNTETLPTWRTVPVPPEFATTDTVEILRGRYDGRITWRKAT